MGCLDAGVADALPSRLQFCYDSDRTQSPPLWDLSHPDAPDWRYERDESESGAEYRSESQGNEGAVATHAPAMAVIQQAPGAWFNRDLR
jgi:hypothetical protein